MNDSSDTDTSGEGTEGKAVPAQGGLPSLEEIPQEEIDEIEAERKRRLDPDNRPEMAEVDNTDMEFDFERGELVEAPRRDGESDPAAPDRRTERSGDEDSVGEDGAGEGAPAPGGMPRLEEIPQEEIDEIEAERKRRLDPDNRPEMSEVDNTHREFDLERGEFVDSPADQDARD